MSGVTWFKVLTDIFADDKIKIIQSMPEGDSLLIMWFKVLAQAGKTNDGGYIYLKKDIPYTSAMLATLFGKQQHLVELAMKTFNQFGMIDVDERGYVFVTNWEKHQAVDKLDKIREQTSLRVAKHREKKKLELQECSVTVTQNVTPSNATDIDKELDKDKEKNKKSKYAEFVSLTEDEYEKLISEYGEDMTQECIKILDNYKGANGKKYKSDYRAMLNWVVEKVLEKKKITPKGKSEKNKALLQRKMQEALYEEDGNDQASLFNLDGLPKL